VLKRSSLFNNTMGEANGGCEQWKAVEEDSGGSHTHACVLYMGAATAAEYDTYTTMNNMKRDRQEGQYALLILYIVVSVHGGSYSTAAEYDTYTTMNMK
jgi:hypothetical protein